MFWGMVASLPGPADPVGSREVEQALQSAVPPRAPALSPPLVRTPAQVFGFSLLDQGGVRAPGLGGLLHLHEEVVKEMLEVVVEAVGAGQAEA